MKKFAIHCFLFLSCCCFFFVFFCRRLLHLMKGSRAYHKPVELEQYSLIKSFTYSSNVGQLKKKNRKYQSNHIIRKVKKMKESVKYSQAIYLGVINTVCEKKTVPKRGEPTAQQLLGSFHYFVISCHTSGFHL